MPCDLHGYRTPLRCSGRQIPSSLTLCGNLILYRLELLETEQGGLWANAKLILLVYAFSYQNPFLKLQCCRWSYLSFCFRILSSKIKVSVMVARVKCELSFSDGICIFPTITWSQWRWKRWPAAEWRIWYQLGLSLKFKIHIFLQN